MKQLLLVAAFAGALTAAAGMGFAQQQAAPGVGAEPTTCSQSAEFCNRSCDSESGLKHRECQALCQTHRAECMATGFWKNASTGKLLPRHKE
jgi:hypothetical protein